MDGELSLPSEGRLVIY